MEKGWLWCKRRPAVASLLVTIVILAAIGTLVATERQNATHAEGLVESLLKADTAQVPSIIADMEMYQKWANPKLTEAFDKSNENSKERLHASLALLSVDPKQVGYLKGRLLVADPEEVDPIRRVQN